VADEQSSRQQHLRQSAEGQAECLGAQLKVSYNSQYVNRLCIFLLAGFNPFVTTARHNTAYMNTIGEQLCPFARSTNILTYLLDRRETI